MYRTLSVVTVIAAHLAAAVGAPVPTIGQQRPAIPVVRAAGGAGVQLLQKVSQRKLPVHDADVNPWATPPAALDAWTSSATSTRFSAGVAGISAALAGAIISFHRLFGKASAPPAPLHAEPSTGAVYPWETALATLLITLPASPALAAAPEPGYSLASYYTALGTFLLALPGLVSLVTRSVKSKVVRKTYVLPGPKAPGGLPQKEIAGKLLFYLTKKRSMELKEASKTVTFRGKLPRRQGQAAFLTFCVFLCLLSLGLVIQTIEAASLGEGEGLGNWWYGISALSPLAGKYYLDNAETEQELQVKIVSDDEEKETEVVVQGDDAELEALRLEFDWPEKGLVRVKGILEDQIRGAA